MRDHLDAFARHLAAGHAAPRTVRTYGAVLASLADTLPPPGGPLTRAQVEAFLGRRRRDGAPRAASTRNQELAAIRAYVAFARDSLGWAEDPARGVAFVREPPRAPTVLSALELSALFGAAARASRSPARDLALLAALSQAALRVHEAVALDVGQVDLASRTLLSVRGKGGTTFDLPLNAPAAALLAAWIAARRAPVGERALFVSGRGTRLSVRAVEALLQRLRAPMGTSKRVTPHTLRHTAATLTLTAGTDLATVGELLRHSDLNTTRRYLHLVDTRRREAVRRLEGTVPVEVLPALEASARAEEQGGLGKTPEAPGSRRNPELDDQCGLDAKSSPTIRPSPATNASAPPDGGAFQLGGAGEGGPDLRGGPMFRLIPLMFLSICLAAMACSTPASAPADAAAGADAAGDTFDADAEAGADAMAGPDAVLGTDIAMGADAVGPEVGADAAVADAADADGALADTSGTDGVAGDATPPDAGLHPSAVARLSCAADSECDDGIPCTLDACDLGPRCVHLARPAMCGAGETCDIRMGCRPGRACATDADCADADPCTLGERCSADSRVCVYASVLDGDRDGFAPRACGGGDCDDAQAAAGPGEPERCNGADDNCDGRTDEGTARELCGEGASCTSASNCVLDAPEDYADLARVCALEVACLGTLERLGVSLATGGRCAEALAGQLARAWVDGRLIITQLTPGPGESRRYEEGRRSDPAPVREALGRARTATTCADYLGPQYARWTRCMRGGSHCEGDLLVACLSGRPSSVTDCSALGGCVPGDFGASCRMPPAACSVAPRDHVRCDGDAIRVGCGEAIACPAGSRCTATVSETAMGPTRVWQFQASCAPNADAVRLRCPDGSMVDAPVRACPTGAAPPCTARGTCDGNRLTLCIDNRRTEFDCAALTGGACEGTTCSPR